MKSFVQKHHRLLFYGCWLLLALLQAYFTELQDDEAYYWVYAKYLSWGYFDHPPMIALMIKMGGFLFSKELGVRFFPVLLNTLTVYVTEKLTAPKNPFLFYAICLSVAVLQVAGFMAVPDIPLLFFTALFFLCYKHYVQKPNGRNTVLVAIAIACLLYSKYHGVLVVFFTLLSNIQLFKQYKTYIIFFIVVLLFMPHIWWQYQHNWVSIKYHLFESNVNRYKFSYTTDYILGQILIAGPFAGIILLYSTFAYRTQNATERALKYTAVGIFIFFFLSSFKGQVEANWTSPALIPMLVLTYRFLQQHLIWKRWLIRLLPLSIIVVLLVRFVIIVDVLPVHAIVKRYHAWSHWPQQLKKETHGLPVVFNNSYQRASKYWFYTGQMCYSLNSYKERRNNYNFWPVEDSLLGKAVYNMDIYDLEVYPHTFPARLWTIGYSFDSSFHSFAKIQLQPEKTTYKIAADSSLFLNIHADVPAYYYHYLQLHPQVDKTIVIGIFKGKEWIKDIPCPFTLQQLVSQPQQRFFIDPQLPEGDYFFRFAIASDTRFATHNSSKISLKVQ